MKQTNGFPHTVTAEATKKHSATRPLPLLLHMSYCFALHYASCCHLLHPSVLHSSLHQSLFFYLFLSTPLQLLLGFLKKLWKLSCRDIIQYLKLKLQAWHQDSCRPATKWAGLFELQSVKMTNRFKNFPSLLMKIHHWWKIFIQCDLWFKIKVTVTSHQSLMWGDTFSRNTNVYLQTRVVTVTNKHFIPDRKKRIC